jgi:methylmalonyl-CoA mutase
MTTPTPLADIFPQFTEDDWRKAASRATRSAANGGASVAPAARDIAQQPITGMRSGQPWVATGRVTEPTAAEAVAAALDDINGGAAAVEFATIGGMHPLSGRLPRDTATAVLSALPTGTAVRIDVDDPALADVAATHGVNLTVAFDPVAAIATGLASDVDASRLTELAGQSVSAAAIADGRPWHAGGASDEQELGVVLASFIHHYRLAGPQVGITLTADADQFATTAKFRAMRLLLARLAEAGGVAIAPRIHAETAWRSMARAQPEINILRATSAAFGAAAGGADSITVLPFDALTGASASARRLARNTQTILAAETHMWRVADPAAGSGAIEAMTATLAEAAWREFQRIEAEGGIVAAIRNGRLMRDIARERDARWAEMRDGRTRMVGVGGVIPDAAVRTAADNSSLVYRRVAEAFET